MNRSLILLNVLSVTNRASVASKSAAYHTLCGVIRVEHWVYHCPSGHYPVPWDAEQKLKGQYTHRVAESMCRLAAYLDFRDAAEELSRQGIEMSHTTLHQSVREWSEDLSVSEQVETQKPRNSFVTKTLHTLRKSGTSANISSPWRDFVFVIFHLK